MTAERYLLFVFASALLIATPGPNVALIVGTSIRHGFRTGYATMMGVNFGLVVQLLLVVLGLASAIAVFSDWFDVIRYCGAAYLIVLALTQLLRREEGGEGGAAGVARRRLSGVKAFARGALVALSNPKTLLFHAAFLPQFLNPDADPVLQIWLLAATFAAVAAIGDGMFVWVAARTGSALSKRYARITDRLSAFILLGGAALLLAIRRD